jgi:hypothetical protein
MNDCKFRNFKECLHQPGIKETPNIDNYVYDMHICAACLLSRIEKALFKLTQKDKVENVSENR